MLHPSSLAEALLHRHRARSAIAASKRRNRSFLVPWRAARARFASWRTSRLPIEHGALADLAWLSARPTRGALRLPPLAEALLQRHRARSAATASKRLNRSFKIPRRSARAHVAQWRTGRPPTEHALYAAELAWYCLRGQLATRSTPPRAVGRGSSSPTPCQVGGCGFETP